MQVAAKHSAFKKKVPDVERMTRDDFEEWLKATVFIDCLNTEIVKHQQVTALLNQWAEVVEIKLFPDYLKPGQRNFPCGLARLKNSVQARNVVCEMFEKICLCGGTPRPVRALMAHESMFPDRPKKESRSVAWRFVEFKTEEGTFVKQKVRMAIDHVEQIQQLRENHNEDLEKLQKAQEEELIRRTPCIQFVTSVMKDKYFEESLKGDFSE